MLSATLAEPVRSEPGRRSFLRVRLTRDASGGLVAVPFSDQNSGLLRPLALADALLICGPERTDLQAGERVLVQVLEPMASPRDSFAPPPPAG
jgi:molybdopterin molybdotransferase